MSEFITQSVCQSGCTVEALFDLDQNGLHVRTKSKSHEFDSQVILQPTVAGTPGISLEETW